MRTQRPLAIEYTAALAFSYESANEEEREFCVRSLEDMEYFRRPPPIGHWTKKTIMANVKGYVKGYTYLPRLLLQQRLLITVN